MGLPNELIIEDKQKIKQNYGDKTRELESNIMH